MDLRILTATPGGERPTSTKVGDVTLSVKAVGDGTVRICLETDDGTELPPITGPTGEALEPVLVEA